MCGQMLEYPSQLIPHWMKEGIELLWSVDLDMCNIFSGIRYVEPLVLW